MHSLVCLYFFAFLGQTFAYSSINSNFEQTVTRRSFFRKSSFISIAGIISASTNRPNDADAIGPVKLMLKPIEYTAKICPKDRPIPGEKAMKGMKGLCVTVKAELMDPSPKELEKVGVYGFVIDAASGESVLANNPDLSTDAGQFAMVESIKPSTKTVEFEFIAAVPMDTDLSKFDRGIGDLEFRSLRVISFPGGQQFGAISPCEMNSFSDECEAWEAQNGPYTSGDFMIKSKNQIGGRN